MYHRHFQLARAPFALTPDTGFFMNRAGYQDALNVLLVALRSGEGFVKVSGEVGTGKTLLCRKLINTLEGEFATAYLHNPFLTPRSLLQAIAGELLLAVPATADEHRLLKALERRVLAIHARGGRVLVCLDEAQALPVETLETLRLLTNLETERRKLLQVVLFGQPELDRLLAAASVRQLRQRITFSYRLLPMNRAGTGAYVAHRLRVAGRRGPPPFSAGTIDLVHAASRGIPRLVNILCHKAMLLAYGRGREVVTRAEVRAAARDTLDAQDDWSRWWLRGSVLLPPWRYSVAMVATLFALGAAWGGLG